MFHIKEFPKILEIFVYPKRWPKLALKWIDWLTVLSKILTPNFISKFRIYSKISG